MGRSRKKSIQPAINIHMKHTFPDLYDYQSNGLAAINQCRQDYAHTKGRDRSIVAVLPTAGGKTQLSIHDILTSVAMGDRCLFLTDAVTLVSQTANRFKRYGYSPGLIAASAGKNPYPDCLVQVASFGTIVNRDVPKDVKLIFIDECHTAGFPASERWWADVDDNGDWIHWHKDAWVIGLTATPWRTKKTESLSNLWKHMIVIAQPPDLLKIGRETNFTQGLVPAIYYGAKTVLDLSAVRTEMGDFRQQDLALAMTGPGVLKATLEQWEAKCYRGTLKSSRRTLYFGAGIAQSLEVAEAFNQRWREQALDEGYPDGQIFKMLEGADSDDERNYWFARIEDNTLVGLTSADLLTQGVDLPTIEAVFPRPTKSRVTKGQQEGRSARTCPRIGKKNFVIVDVGLNAFKYGFFNDAQPYSIARRPPGAAFDAPMKQCPECDELMYGFTMVCPSCGHIFPSAKKTEITGELVELLNGTDRTFARKYRRFARKAFEMSQSPAWAVVRTQEDMKQTIAAKDVSVGQLIKVRANWLLTGPTSNGTATSVRCAQVDVGSSHVTVITPDDFIYEIPAEVAISVLPNANPAAMLGAKPWLSDRQNLAPATLKERAYYWLLLTRLGNSQSKNEAWMRKWYYTEFGSGAEDPTTLDVAQFKLA